MTIQRFCGFCGRSFETRRKDAKTCSGRCRVALSRWRRSVTTLRDVTNVANVENEAAKLQEETNGAVVVPEAPGLQLSSPAIRPENKEGLAIPGCLDSQPDAVERGEAATRRIIETAGAVLLPAASSSSASPEAASGPLIPRSCADCGLFQQSCPGSDSPCQHFYEKKKYRIDEALGREFQRREREKREWWRRR